MRGKRCQSCGMPLSRDPEGGGSEKDGSKSRTYCSICYADGAFRHSEVSVREFQARCVNAMAAKGMPRVIAWVLTRGIPRLERWSS